MDTLSDDEWSLQLVKSGNIYGVVIGRISNDKYKGGFGIYRSYTSVQVPLNTVFCTERIADEDAGHYCQKVIPNSQLTLSATTLRYYRMP